MMAVVGKEAAEKDEVGQEILPRLREQLVALLEGGQLAPVARAEAGEALGRIGDPRPGVCTRLPGMIHIPAGTFLMGDEDEGSQYEIELPAFAIGRYPVTNAQFRFFVEDGGYTEKWRDCWTDEGWEYRQEGAWTASRDWEDPIWSLDNKPVVRASWYEAVAYANWLSRVEGRSFSLPTEAQWERAARHTDGRQYPWGDEWQDGIVNSEVAGIGRTTAVGSFPGGAAECGADDLSGNVWEWCQSRYDDGKTRYPLPYRPDDGREELAGGRRVRRILRGGAFYVNLQYVRAALRNDGYPNYRGANFGFRVVEHLLRS
jgi:formylglycine-generating enzyme required for sulfatase activity